MVPVGGAEAVGQGGNGMNGWTDLADRTPEAGERPVEVKAKGWGWKGKGKTNPVRKGG